MSPRSTRPSILPAGLTVATLPPHRARRGEVFAGQHAALHQPVELPWMHICSTGPTCCCAGPMSSQRSPGSAPRSTSSCSTTACRRPSTRTSGQGRRWRDVGRARRRLLSLEQVHGGAQVAAPLAEPALVLLGELLDLADRLPGCSPSSTCSMPAASWSTRACSTGRRRRPSVPRSASWRVLADLRRHLPHAGPEEEWRPAGRALVLGFIVFASWLACQLFRRPRRLPAGRRHDRHRDERQRVLLDHPGPAQGGRADAMPAKRSTRSTASAASSAACTTPTSRCRC